MAMSTHIFYLLVQTLNKVKKHFFFNVTVDDIIQEVTIILLKIN